MRAALLVATSPIPAPRYARVANVGDLVVTAGNATRREMAEWMREQRNGWWWSVMSDLFEEYSCSGSFEPFDAGQGDPFVGLTSTCCIAESLDYPDEGPRVLVGRLWFFDRWDTEDPLKQLRNTGRTVFRLAWKE